MRISLISAVVLVSIVIIHSETTITNSVIGFSTTLPQNWICTQTSDSTAIVNDTTLEYKSQIVIKKYHRSQIDYPTPNDWTRAHFIAYLLVTDYSFDPFGAVLYYDSSSSCKQGEFWATEAFSEFYSLDTVLGAWSELIRFTAGGEFGYSLYAIGDTSDMKQNIGMYAAVLRSISILQQSTSIARNSKVKQILINQTNFDRSNGAYDLAGRRHKSILPQGHLVTVRKLNGNTFTSVKLK
ncbi:MAG: hypothetical protein JW915_06935 [Chitinispirillaceae bacterium]|nr:hypothetical protein [Chitinispirillaceae bacterium]